MIIIDNFIQDEELLNKMQTDEYFGKIGFNWYDGWWKDGIQNVRHELIHAIWGPNSPHPNVRVRGFEHWIGDYNENSEITERLGMEWSLAPHFDRDEEYWYEHKKLIGPMIGTIYYPDPEIDEVEGGMLYIWEGMDNTKFTSEGYLIIPEEDPQIIKPKFNRLVIFDASALHAVSRIRKGRRRAVAINLWDKPITGFEKMYG